MSSPPTVPHYAPDLFSDEVIADPYPHYAALRELGPVAWLPATGAYVLSRFDEVGEALRRPLDFVSSKGLSLQPRVNELLVGSTLNSDPPIHDLTRSVTSAPLLPGALLEHVPRIEAAARGLIDGLVARRRFDAVTDLAQFLPVTIVAELVGLPDAGRENMLRWASATFNLFGPDNARSRAAFTDLRDLRRFLEAEGRPERLQPGGWAQQIFRNGQARGLSLQTCAQLMRDYINPSLDTTISATGQAVGLFAEHPDQWDLVRADRSLIPNAVEEVVRLASPIRLFSRYVARDTEIGGVMLPQGARVLVCYASANRDPRKYHEPDRFDVRRDVHDHMGFGHGVHMCMGMHLARIEIIALLEALADRVERFVPQGQGVVAMNNVIRAFASLPIEVVPAPVAEHPGGKPTAKRQSVAPAPTAGAGAASPAPWFEVRVLAAQRSTPEVLELTLGPTTDQPLPSFSAGSHIDVRLAPDLVRQYSLCGDPHERGHWQIGVLREADGRGSARMHALVPGDLLTVSQPRNHFALEESAQRTVLIAGGIGLTPLLSMAHRLRGLGRPFDLIYRVRSAGQRAFTGALGQLGDAVRVSYSDTEPSGQFDLAGLLGKPAPGVHLYVCGPDRFMSAVIDAAWRAGWSNENIHRECFSNTVDGSGQAFELVLARSNRRLTVPPDSTIAQALAGEQIFVPMSCRSGVCGTCLTTVLAGTPDHRDLVQTEAQKAANERITVCCSRAHSLSLTLDL
ncbi:MAG: cytochrome P450/oxidoreductase [Burkholderiaceae bacterium]